VVTACLSHCTKVPREPLYLLSVHYGPLTRAGKPRQDLASRSYMVPISPPAPASPPGCTRLRWRALAKQGLGHQGKPP